MSARMIDISLILNGRPVEPFAAREDMLLIDFLHEELALTGTKFGCGIGECQACTVAVRGDEQAELKTKKARKMRVNQIDGKQLTTVEGLAKDGRLSALQQAFLDHYAFQCGCCTPGILVAASVLLDKLEKEGKGVPEAELNETILDAIGWNLCRCTGYAKYVDSVRSIIANAD